MSQLRNYIIVTGAYWSFMLTDGALRMFVLLYFHEQGYSPVSLSFLLLFYEFFGIVTNLFGGRLAYKFGLKSTLVYGLALQIGAILMLSLLQKDWSVALAIPFVMTAQSISGIAKDLTKISSKTLIKFLIPKDKGSTLFKFVAILTGSKNAIKGFGFFTGGYLLQKLSFQHALWSMAIFIGVVFILSVLLLPSQVDGVSSKKSLPKLFEQNRNIKILSAARAFLFGARDIWFVVALPVFLSSMFHWNFTQVGSFMAIWVIIYGVFQALAPNLIKLINKNKAPTGSISMKLTALLVLCMTTITILFVLGIQIKLSIVGGLCLFGAVFAITSSVHSFLVLDYADGDKASINVGFYYMANAVGRLIGTLLSGVLYQYGGIDYCLIGSIVFLLIATIISQKLPKG